MMEQFNNKDVFRTSAINISIGITFFTLGLFKKVMLADNLAPYANVVFEQAHVANLTSTFLAWIGALAYTLQIYFDFSGYCDMAVGISHFFGVKLPANFNSPYKAINIIDFWRRWHITLSKFLRDYLYIPLGGNRLGEPRRYANLLTTMVLGGIWHGAGFTFIIWGALHGLFLAINHGFQTLRSNKSIPIFQSTFFTRFLSHFVTMICIVVTWVYFRSPDLATANYMIKKMFRFSIPKIPYDGFWIDYGVWLVVTGLLICWMLPNTQQIMQDYKPVIEYKGYATGKTFNRLKWKPTVIWAAFILILCVISLSNMHKITEFLYYNF